MSEQKESMTTGDETVTAESENDQESPPRTNCQTISEQKESMTTEDETVTAESEKDQSPPEDVSVQLKVKQELAFRGHDESSTSINRGNYVELLKYTAEYDPLLKAHLETSTVFKGVSNRIQNDLIEAVAKSLLEEIKLANYVAVLVDETTDVSNTAQFSIVHNGQTKGRFIGFQGVSENRTAPEIAELIRQYLTEFDSNDKLIAQSYDGAASMAGRINGVQALIKQTHSQALFVHCYAHCLNLVLSNTVNNIKECKIVFSTLSGIAAFFSRSPKRTKFLDAFLQRRLPSVAPTRWNYTKRLVNTVYVHRNDLYKVFDAMLNNSSEIEKDILAPVKGYLLNLRDFTFCFLLRTFDKIFAFTSVLYSILQSKSFDIAFCRKKVDETRRNISAMRNEFETVFAETADEVGESCKRNVNYKQIYYEIFDNVDSHLESRFQDYGSLGFLGLISSENGIYDIYQKQFPQIEFSNLLSAYGNHFEEVRLRNELTVFYAADDFKEKTHLKIVESFLEDLEELKADFQKYRFRRIWNRVIHWELRLKDILEVKLEVVDREKFEKEMQRLGITPPSLAFSRFISLRPRHVPPRNIMAATDDLRKHRADEKSRVSELQDPMMIRRVAHDGKSGVSGLQAPMMIRRVAHDEKSGVSGLQVPMMI
ncbi:hypothetical protein ANN_09762 [Periplaneta americana]|uniref:DUF4371 domain-containing protein n=1 Tax=Periplaneta americana TaxID=6978 RepID=A0ABQ8TQ71_PERAM|nr:hypothetical protein ANN_09762 [Periplaneta americana]